jgi:N-acetylmuramic acid 6-phosphate etherase
VRHGRTSKRRNISQKRLTASLEDLASESINPASADLDKGSSLEIAQIINSEDAKVAGAVARALPEIAKAIDWVAESLDAGGRLFYVGTGTSGRIAALDAVECPPTFDTDPKSVQFIIAGGARALSSAAEADEDSPALGVQAIRKKRPGKKDVVVGIAASGRTPFTVAAVKYARSCGAKTAAVTCNAGSPLENAAELAIVLETGPEVVAGSTRMKAGTVQKMVLNMISTGAMVRLGYVYGNLMVNLRQKNVKLTERAVTIVQRILGVDRDRARESIRHAENDLRLAIIKHIAGVNTQTAKNALKQSRGHLRQAIQFAQELRGS